MNPNYLSTETDRLESSLVFFALPYKIKTDQIKKIQFLVSEEFHPWQIQILEILKNQYQQNNENWTV